MHIKNTLLLSLLAATSSITFISAAEGGNTNKPTVAERLQHLHDQQMKLYELIAQTKKASSQLTQQEHAKNADAIRLAFGNGGNTIGEFER